MITKEILGLAINDCDDRYIDEVAETLVNKRNIKPFFLWNRAMTLGARVAVVMLVCLLVCGTGVAVAAVVSESFREYLADIFGSESVTEVRFDNNIQKNDLSNSNPIAAVTGTAAETETSPTPLVHPGRIDGEDTMIDMEKHSQIFGNRQVFIDRGHYDSADKYITEEIYTLQGNNIVKLNPKHFEGTFENKNLSFDYVVVDDEIVMTCNRSSDSCEYYLFSLTDGSIAYANIITDIDEDIIKKEYIIRLHLDTGKIESISNENMICNFVESPGGTHLLCNHRSDGYWSDFNLHTGEERKIDGIDGYAHTGQIRFLDEDHVITLGEEIVTQTSYGATSKTGLSVVNLKTNKIEKTYPECGDIALTWYLEEKNGKLLMHNMLDDSSVPVPELPPDTSVLSENGNYAVLHKNQSSAGDIVIFNTSTGRYRVVKIPKKMAKDDLEYQLSSCENKLMITNKKKAYLVDLTGV